MSNWLTDSLSNAASNAASAGGEYAQNTATGTKLLLGASPRNVFTKTMTDADKQKAEKDQRNTNIVRGLAGAGLATGLAATYVPTLAGATGRMNLYHGTEGKNVSSILKDGLSLDRAGQARRLNSVLMEDSLYAHAAKHVPGFLSNDALQGKFLSDLNTPLGDKGYASTLERNARHFAAHHAPDAAHAFTPEALHGVLKERGKRIYFGNTPAAVVDWGSKHTEAEMIGNKLMNKSNNPVSHLTGLAKNVANTLTGGLVGHAANAIPQAQYALSAHKAERHTGAAKDLAAFVATHDLGGHHAVLKTTIGKGQLRDLGAFKDFPGLGVAAAAMSGMGEMLKDHGLPNYSPGRDLSVGANVAGNQIREIHFLHPETKAISKIFQNTDYVKPVAETLGGRARALALPLAATAAGAEILSRSLTGKGLVTHAQDAYKHLREEKQAAMHPLTRKALGTAGVVGLGAAGLSAAVGAAMYPAQQVENVGKKYPGADTGANVGNEVVGQLAVPALGATTVGAGAAAVKHYKANPISGVLGAYGGSVAGTALAVGGLPTAAVSHWQTALSDVSKREDPVQPFGEYAKDTILPATLLGGGLAAHVAYHATRNYPVKARAAMNTLSSVKDKLLKPMHEGADAAQMVRNRKAFMAAAGATALPVAGAIIAAPAAMGAYWLHNYHKSRQMAEQQKETQP